MKKFLLTIWFLIPVIAMAQDLIHSRTSSYFTFIYKITNQEAAKLYTREKSEIHKELFHTLIDFYPADSAYQKQLPSGHYLFVRTIAEQFSVELESVNNLDMTILNNSRDLLLLFHDVNGKSLTTLLPRLEKKRILFSEKYQAYFLPKTNREGWIQVELNGHTNWFNIKRRYNNTFYARSQRRILGTFPINHLVSIIEYIPKNIVQLIRYQRMYPPGIYYRMRRLFEDKTKKYEGFMVLSKPKYKPGDTVKLKAFILTHKGNPVSKKLDITLSSYSSFNRTNRTLGTIKPYRPGAYTFNFILHDSLKLSLDRQYYINLEDNKNSDYPSEGFSFEEYELKANIFSITQTPSENPHQPPTLTLKGKDTNDLPLYDVRVDLFVIPKTVKKFYDHLVFVPDTLWKHHLKLDPLGDTNITLPDSLYPNAAFDYDVVAHFTNAENERQVKTMGLFYDRQAFNLITKVERDSLFISSDHTKSKYGLIAQNAIGKTFFEKQIELPHREKIESFIRTFQVQDDGTVVKEIDLEQQADQLDVMAERTKDSLKLLVENPRKLLFRYQLFRNNAVIESGTTLSYTTNRKTSANDRYYFSIQYVWAGTARVQNFDLPFAKKPLSITIDHPVTVFPGQSVDFAVNVKDAYGKPVQDADLTAYAITKKFQTGQDVDLPVFEKFKSRKLFNEFHTRKIDQQKYKSLLEYDFWKTRLGLDSISFYHFLYPEKGFYFNYSASDDSITQIAPYVVRNGLLQQVYYIYFENVLQYLSGTNTLQPYSFQSDTGKISMTLRLHDRVLTFTSPKIKQGEKLIISLDLNNLPDFVASNPLPNALTELESKKIKPHFLWITRSGSQTHAYFQQDQRLHLLPANGNLNGRELAGPFFPGTIQYQTDFNIDFYFKPSRTYQFQPNLIDREIAPDNFKFSLWPKTFNAAFTDQVLTEKRIRDYWKSLEEKTTYTFRKYPDYNQDSKHTGSLTIQEKYAFKNIKRLATYILNLDNPDVYYIYPGHVNDFKSLQVGLYQVIVIYNDEQYIRPDPVSINANGRTFLDLTQTILHPPDTFSRNVLQKIQQWSVSTAYVNQVRQKEMQDIRQLYYEEASRTDDLTGGYWITGTVIDPLDHSPIPGVNVIVKGTVRGTTTNMNGEYRIYAPLHSTLVFSFIGYSTQEMYSADAARQSILLQQDVQHLSEVIVTGYGVQYSKSLTSSVSKLEGSLAGRIAGVQVGSGFDEPVSIKIRGAQAFTENNNPLVIVDGVVVPWKSVNQKIITSIEVLNASDAVALYGSRAANGVILISTKPGTTRAQLLQTKLPAVSTIINLDETVPGTSLRKNFRDDALWQPRLRSDKNGIAKFTATFPDDITAWKLHVIGVASSKRAGEARSELRSFKPLVAQLAMPNFTLEGDSAWAIAKITNYTADSLTVYNSLSINNQIVTHGEHALKNSLLDSVLLMGVGDSLVVKYEIEHKGYRDGEQRKIYVLPLGSRESKGVFMALPKDTTFILHFDGSMGDIKLSAESDMLDVLLDEIQVLKIYPYECNEQLASKLKALLAEKSIRSYKKEKFKHDNLVEKLIKKISTHQYTDGGWSWWGSGKGSIWITRHVAEALTWAEKLGYAAIYDRVGLRNFLMNIDSNSSAEEQLKSYILLAASGEKVIAKSLIDSLSRNHKLYNQYYKLLAQRLLHVSGQTPDWNWIESQKRETLKGNWYWGEKQNTLWNNDVDNTLLVYQLMEHRNSNDPDLFRLRNYLLETRSPHWTNTYAASNIIGVLLPGLLKQGSKSVKPSLLIVGNKQEEVTSFPFAKTLQNIESISVTKSGDAPVYFTAYQEVWNPKPEKVEKDFVIKTQWHDDAKQLKAGKPVMLEVSLEVKKDADYVMINVPIPAGCSYESKSQSRTNGEVHREYDIHETRIYCERLRAGKYTYSISLQPRYKGKYHLNPAQAEWMYFPVIFGRTECKVVEVK